MEVVTPLVSQIDNATIGPVVSLTSSAEINSIPEVEAPVETIQEDPIKLLTASFLNLPKELYSVWDVIDRHPTENPKLVMVSYNKNFDRDNRLHEPLKAIRGLILDLETGATVADSFGYTEKLPCFEPLIVEKSPSSPEGILKMATTKKLYVNTFEANPEEAPKLGVGHREFDMSRVRLFPGYEGVLVRVFLWHGQTFFSTYKKIDATRSFWGSRKPYYDLYKELNGPDLRSLFGPEEQFSPYCHFFLITHNELRLASSTKDNRLFYVGVHKVWSEEKYAHEAGPYLHLADFKLRIPEFTPITSSFSSNLNHDLTEMTAISVDLANKWAFPDSHATPYPSTQEAAQFHIQENELIPEYDATTKRLKDVFGARSDKKMADDRLAGGDFLVMYVRQDDGSTRVFQVEPPAFAFRSLLVNNNPVFYNQFVVKTSSFHKSDPTSLTDEYPELRDNDGHSLDLSRPEVRLHYWHSLFYRAVPPTYKAEVENYDRRFAGDLQKITDFIIREVPGITDPEEQKRIGNKPGGVWHRFLDIRATATKGDRGLYQSVISMLRRENGTSLYRMIGALETSAQYRKLIKESKKN